MSRYRRSLWQYPLFQIPLMFLGIFLAGAALFWLLGLGRPDVAVAIALDLSSSTYAPQSFNAPGTVMAQELAAVRSYIEQNSQKLRTPNEIYVLGFGDRAIALTSSFTSDRQKLEAELSQSLANPILSVQVGSGTDLGQAIEQGTKVLSSIQKRCRELLLVTDGEAKVTQSAVTQAANQRVKINAVVVGADAPQLRQATSTTRGIYLTGQQNNLQAFFTEEFFTQFNSNRNWIIFWLGAAWISFMWLLTLPLDKWIFQDLMKLPMNLAGQLALGNALFWSIATPLVVWRLGQLFGSPFFSSC